MNNPIRFALRAPVILLFLAAMSFWMQGASAQSSGQASKMSAKEAERKARLTLKDEALEKLYKLQPEARKVIERAPGYAVFDVTSVYIILFVGQKGTGVLVDNTSKKVTYMSSSRVGTGPGAGKQRVFQIFVFKAKGAMDQFVLAGGLGGDVGASVSTGDGGMVRSFNPEIDIYQIPESGFALQASWGGTVYSVDSNLQ